MQSGRVMPVLRQFFTSSLTSKTNKDANSQNQQSGGREREPTDEETRKAFDFLLQQEEFKTQGLKVELQTIEERLCIVVSDFNGNQVRTIRGPSILRVLENTALGNSAHFRGRILDRRL